MVAGVVGSFAYNMTMTLGAAALSRPLALTDAAALHKSLVAMMASFLLVILIALISGRLNRLAGVLLLAAYPAVVWFGFMKHVQLSSLPSRRLHLLGAKDAVVSLPFPALADVRIKPHRGSLREPNEKGASQRLQSQNGKAADCSDRGSAAADHLSVRSSL